MAEGGNTQDALSPNHPQPVRGIATLMARAEKLRSQASQPPPTRPRDCNFSKRWRCTSATCVPTTPNPSEGLQRGRRCWRGMGRGCPNHPQPVRGIATSFACHPLQVKPLSQPPPTRPRDCNSLSDLLWASVRLGPNHPQPVRGIATPVGRPFVVLLCKSQPPPTRPRDCNFASKPTKRPSARVPTTPNPSEGLQRELRDALPERAARPNHPQPVRGIATNSTMR